MKKLSAFVLTALFVLLAAACSSPKFNGIGLELISVARGAGDEVTATVRITNSNVVAFNFAESRHGILLDGREIGTLTISSATGVPSQSTVEQTGVVTLKRGAALPAGSATYQLKSDIVIRLYGDRTENAKFGGSGTVTVR